MGLQPCDAYGWQVCGDPVAVGIRWENRFCMAHPKDACPATTDRWCPPGLRAARRRRREEG